MTQVIEKTLTPDRIIQVGMGFWASKTLLTAVNLGLFTCLSEGPLSVEQIRHQLDLNERGTLDFLDALVALGFLSRTGLKAGAIYQNTEETNLFLDRNKPSYIGGILEMSNNRLYPFWDHLEEALQTGLPQNETKYGGKPVFETLYEDEARLREFTKAMGSFQAGNFMRFAETFDFSGYQTHCDVGGAGGDFSLHITMRNPHMRCITFDLPKVTPIAQANIDVRDLSDQVIACSGDFFQDALPQAEVITMGNILHDWGLDKKKILIGKAYEALPAGGSLAVIETFIDDNREENAFGLMMSLNMLIETDSGYDCTSEDFELLAREVGFREIYQIRLTGPASAMVAVK